MVESEQRVTGPGSIWQCIECGDNLETGYQVIRIDHAEVEVCCSVLCVVHRWLRGNLQNRNDLLDSI